MLGATFLYEVLYKITEKTKYTTTGMAEIVSDRIVNDGGTVFMRI